MSGIRQLWTTFFMPDAPREAADWFDEMQHASSSGETAMRLLLALGDFDVTDRLAQVRCPTLVMHLEVDLMIPLAAGQRVAVGIPGAVFMPLRGGNHIPLQSDPAFVEMLAAIDRFLSDETPALRGSAG
jgi:pimeloyl-ACP methyl ester carboxylesterase